MPLATSIGFNAFSSCGSLKNIDCTNVAYVGSNAFYSCANLSNIDLPVAMSICSSAFRNCFRLVSLTLGASTLCTLSNSNAFTSTPIGGYSRHD